MKAVELLLRDIIPDDIDLEGITYDKKGMNFITSEIASAAASSFTGLQWAASLLRFCPLFSEVLACSKLKLASFNLAVSK